MFDPFVIFVCVEGFALVTLVVIWVGVDFHYVVAHGYVSPEWIALIYPQSEDAGSDPDEVVDTNQAVMEDRADEEFRVTPVEE